MTNLTKQGLQYRIKCMKKSGIKIPEDYEAGGVRVWSPEFVELVLNWKGEKPGPKPKG